MKVKLTKYLFLIMSFGLFFGVTWAQSATFTIQGYKTEGASFLSAPEISVAVAPYVGANKTLQDIFAAADAVKALYVREGYPVVRVIAPDQVAQDGVIVLRIVEGKIGSIAIEGNKHHDDDNIRASLPSTLKIGSMPNTQTIVAALALANENPSKQMSLNMQAGNDPGIVAAKITVQDEKPQHFTVGLDNSGSKTTGEARLTLGYEHANLFNQDHVLTAQVATSPESPNKSSSLALGYRLPIYPLGISLETSVAYSDSNTGTYQSGTDANGAATTTAFTGKGTIFGIKINQPLSSLGAYRHKLFYAFDYKDYKNSYNNNGTALTAAESGTITSAPVSLGYNGQYTSPALQAGGNLAYYHNIPIGPHGKKSDWEFVSGNPTYRKANWSALRAGLFVSVPLSDWTLRVATTGQASNDSLASVEQFGIGGAYSIRGYSERTFSGDNGHYSSAEIYTPDFGNIVPSGNTNLKALAFYDNGRFTLKNTPLTVGDTKGGLASAGLGLRAELLNMLSLRLDVGVALNNVNSTTDGVTRKRGDTNTHIGINLRF